MILELALWNLADSPITIAELRRHVRDDAAGVFADAPGLVFRAWIADEATERWGAVSVWETREAAEQPLPSKARDLIRKGPEIAEVFDVEAMVSVADEISRRGLAFDI